MSLVALDLFAGTGWGVACQRLGIEEYGVEIMDEAVQTRDAAGMTTIFRDVWEGLEAGWWVDLPERAANALDRYDLLIASPPCQTFSVAGKGAGRKALDDVLGAITFGAYKTPETLRAATEGLDDRTALVLTPLTYAYRDRPTYIVLEQVPTVLPVWEACAEVLRGIGYSVVTGVLNAEQYGVPQTRKRAILFARKDGVEAAMPTPTHSRYYSRSPEKLDEGVQKWVSMAEALGWTGDGLVGFPRRADGRGEVVLEGVAYRSRDLRPDAEPSQTVTEKARSWKRFDVAGSEFEWPYTRPATTIVADPRLGGPGRSEFVKGGVSRQNRPGSMKLEAHQAATLQSYPEAFPFRGSKTNRFLQIGNAVPPLLGEAILRPIAATAALRGEVAA